MVDAALLSDFVEIFFLAKKIKAFEEKNIAKLESCRPTCLAQTRRKDKVIYLGSLAPKSGDDILLQ